MEEGSSAPPSHLDGLNQAQRCAVLYGLDGELRSVPPLLIIAGAGSGKTLTLAHRVAELILGGADPRRVLLLTFSRRAAQEMRRRAERIVSVAIRRAQAAGQPMRATATSLRWAGTFHSVANRLLRRFGSAVGLSDSFTVMDRSDSEDLLNLVRSELGLSERARRFPRKGTCLAVYSRTVNSEQGLGKVLEQHFPWWCAEWEESLRKLFRAYVELKQARAILDYDDLLLYWAHTMQEPAIAGHVGELFDHVLVDEYQDTNCLQSRILLGLRPRGDGITVVGDDAQAITLHHSDLLEVELARRNIPFVKYGGLKFLEAAHVKDLLAVLRWAQNSRDSPAAFRTLQLLSGVGPGTARDWIDHLDGHNGDWEALRECKVPTAAGQEFPALLDLLIGLAGARAQWPADVGRARAWYEPYLEALYEAPVVRAGDLEQLEHIAAHYPNRERFLSELIIDPPQASGDHAGPPHLDEDYLILSTIHSAKGQEWDSVHVLNVVDGCIPSDMATGTTEEIDEERRLLYVAMTRAERELHLIHPLRFYVTHQRRLGSKHVYAPLSRFLPVQARDRFERVAPGEIEVDDEVSVEGVVVDVGSKLREMW